ncbi:MAG TPA: hypothetical protein DEE98_08505 [Elusimicrobia bacterium]|nr:MAG: hypothetical protein A2278_05095 [Elusimicrobia bacterium RIFOXYA12_FULL_49_49]OGS09268.1 MAG: hypothetical protein A2386_02440 [Elusimicrobia bacterium RIFOXYB1_FULL_48_9]OGS09289.1 MAG: hypothetical protein A2204_05215 [Elusimicrobia bacterium RIFOXYA1_FULL_47_7]OGS15207.1 MAG: hypothetical protein A2251_06825 [Elusimicrobia bacterium RIFOXYA2_FULL_47_53]OGS25938.1 MAG: hypothetical protein A2339_00980 [Elusimicrobia bacterium RIFOXYB12_FULL_50_12]OGS30258.1 MAG: hypothetical protein
MDFESVFRLILTKFNQENVTFALIGGFAVHSAGYTRATTDIDFLVKKEDMQKVKKIMLDYGYELLSEDEEISNYLGKMEELGKVDFLHAHRKYSMAMLMRAVDKDVLGGSFKAKIVIPEDIIGLKLQSSVNDPGRRAKDMLDIETLIKINRKSLNFGLVKEYFDLFEKSAEFDRILKAVD